MLLSTLSVSSALRLNHGVTARDLSHPLSRARPSRAGSSELRRGHERPRALARPPKDDSFSRRPGAPECATRRARGEVPHLLAALGVFASPLCKIYLFYDGAPQGAGGHVNRKPDAQPPHTTSPAEAKKPDEAQYPADCAPVLGPAVAWRNRRGVVWFPVLCFDSGCQAQLFGVFTERNSPSRHTPGLSGYYYLLQLLATSIITWVT